MGPTKRCTRCGVEKPVSAFGRFALHSTGLRPACKDCERGRPARERKYPDLSPEERRRTVARERYRESEADREARRRQSRKWKAKNPEKKRAEDAVYRAIRRGDMVRQPCSVCGERAHAHHADYARPFEVMWLCALHHARQHAAEGRLRSAATP